MICNVVEKIYIPSSNKNCELKNTEYVANIRVQNLYIHTCIYRTKYGKGLVSTELIVFSFKSKLVGHGQKSIHL